MQRLDLSGDLWPALRPSRFMSAGGAAGLGNAGNPVSARAPAGAQFLGVDRETQGLSRPMKIYWDIHRVLFLAKLALIYDPWAPFPESSFRRAMCTHNPLQIDKAGNPFLSKLGTYAYAARLH